MLPVRGMAAYGGDRDAHAPCWPAPHAAVRATRAGPAGQGSFGPAQGGAQLARVAGDHGVRVHAQVLAAGDVTAPAVHVLTPDVELREFLVPCDHWREPYGRGSDPWRDPQRTPVNKPEDYPQGSQGAPAARALTGLPTPALQAPRVSRRSRRA